MVKDISSVFLKKIYVLEGEIFEEWKDGKALYLGKKCFKRHCPERNKYANRYIVNPLSKGEKRTGNSVAVQWSGLSAFTVKGPGLIPGQGTKISQATLVRPKE